MVPPKLTHALADVDAPLDLRDGKITTRYGTTVRIKIKVSMRRTKREDMQKWNFHIKINFNILT